VGVIIPSLKFSIISSAVVGVREIRIALQTGLSTLDPVDFESLFANSIGPPWMYVTGNGFLSSAIQTITLHTHGADNGGIPRIKAQRRFKENDSTLWLIHENRAEAGDTVLSLKGLIRVLLRIP